MRAHVDVLTMTATPIPRTLEMALTGIRDMSTIDTPPEDRRPVLTYVGPYDEGLALGAVRRELLREGQVFWVHNRVATIDRQAAWLQEQLPDARVVVAHGQMDEARPREADDEVLGPRGRRAGLQRDHRERSGRAEREHADRRLARTCSASRRCTSCADASGAPPSGRSATSSSRRTRELTEEAHERLATISKHQSLGSGFQIALRDLEIRGAGNLLGAEQHGHIAAVGFDTYCRILAESVAEMKGEPLPEEKELRIDLPVKAFIPPGWVAQEALRLDLYRRISTAGDHASLAARPRRDRSTATARCRPRSRRCSRSRRSASRAAALGVEEITTFREQVRIRPVALDDALLSDLTERVLRRHVPRGEADAEPGAGAGVRRGHGPLRRAVAAGGGRIRAGPASLIRAVERGAGPSANSRLDSLLVTPRSRLRSVAPIALALCLALLAVVRQLRGARGHAGRRRRHRRAARARGGCLRLPGRSEPAAVRDRGRRRDRGGRLRPVRAHEPDPGALRGGLRGRPTTSR